ncbi:hypothetical protein FJZ39_00420 [Candidatus Saccharibacteria bacterium]|nr:hypothetical protein [Candidatus Saccharibacteria bacterium]
MQIKKTKKPSNILFDDDFASGFEDSRFEKFKPIVKILVTAIVIVGIACTYFLFFHRSGDTKNLNDTYTSNPSQTSADDKAAQDGPEAIETTPEQSPQNSSSASPSSNTHHSSGNSSTPTTKPYDPSKCEPLNNEATRLRQVADQKKTTYDNAFAARKNYGYFYDKYGNSTDAQQTYDNQEAQLNLLQTDWQDALNKGNVAYAKYQECRASL